MKLNKKHIGSSLDDLTRTLSKNQKFRFYLSQEEERYKISLLVKGIRNNEGLSQRELARKTGIPQSVIARIESRTATTVPGIELLTKLFSAVNYRLLLGAEKMKKAA